MADDLYLWIARWPDFQHYKPERDRAPAWIKQYPRQLDDHRYTDLSPRQRALLHDVRMVFARSAYRVRIPVVPRAHHARTTIATLSQRCANRVYYADLEALKHAGFIEFVSRETLDQNLEQLYSDSSPRARPRAREELDQEEEPPIPPQTRGEQTSRSRKTKSERIPFEGTVGSKQLQRAEAFTRNAGHQYEPLGFEEELARFSLPPEEHEQIKSLYATLRTNGAEPDELPWEGDEPPIVT